MADSEPEKNPRVTSFKGTLSKRKSYFETDSLTCKIIYFLLNLHYHFLCLRDLNFKILEQSSDRIPNLCPTGSPCPCSQELDEGDLHAAFPRVWKIFPLPLFPLDFLFTYSSPSSYNVAISDGSLKMTMS